MEKCNIIKDLLPLYIEGLCSEDSNEYVEEHLGECKECKKCFEGLKYSEVYGETVEKKEIDALKKLNQYVSDKDKKSNILFLTLSGILILLPLFVIQNLPIFMIVIYMCMQMLGVKFYFRNVSSEEKGKHLWRIVVQVILLLGSSVTMFCLWHMAKQGFPSLGEMTYMVGPIAKSVLTGIILLSLAILLTYLYRVSQKKYRYSLWSNLSLLNIGLCLAYMTVLFRLDDFETFWNLIVQITVGVYGTFAIMMIVLGWRCYRENKEAS